MARISAEARADSAEAKLAEQANESSITWEQLQERFKYYGQNNKPPDINTIMASGTEP